MRVPPLHVTYSTPYKYLSTLVPTVRCLTSKAKVLKYLGKVQGARVLLLP